MQGHTHTVPTHRNMNAYRNHSGVLIYLNDWLQGSLYTAVKIVEGVTIETRKCYNECKLLSINLVAGSIVIAAAKEI